MSDFLIPTESEGAIFRPLRGKGWCCPPKIELVFAKNPVTGLEENGLRWTRTDAVSHEIDDDGYSTIVFQGPGEKVEPAAGMLEGFIGLENAKDEAILAFAKRWGVLRTCAHQLPCTHANPASLVWNADAGCKDLLYWIDDRPQLLSQKDNDVLVSREPIPANEGLIHDDNLLDGTVAYSVEIRIRADAVPSVVWEPIGVWRNLARKMKELLVVASRLQYGEIPTMSQWKPVLVDNIAGVQHKSNATSLTHPWSLLTELISHWMLIGRVAPFSTANINGPVIELGGVGLFGALATQLFLMAHAAEGLDFCSVCSRPFQPKRRPRSDERSYCLSCGRRAMNREGKRRQRRRARQPKLGFCEPKDRP